MEPLPQVWFDMACHVNNAECRAPVVIDNRGVDVTEFFKIPSIAVGRATEGRSDYLTCTMRFLATDWIVSNPKAREDS